MQIREGETVHWFTRIVTMVKTFFGVKGMDGSQRMQFIAWAAQEAYYNYKDNTCMPNKDCLHCTQLVWRNTKEVGCAKVVIHLSFVSIILMVMSLERGHIRDKKKNHFTIY